MTGLLLDGLYLASSVLFIFGLRSLTRPDTARRGMQLAAAGMVVAVVATLLHHQIVTYRWIALGLAVGATIGWPLGTRVPMTAMPQRIAISHVFGALAATLVGVAEFDHRGVQLSQLLTAALGFEVLFGALTVTGSLMAFGKLHELLPGRPITFAGQNPFNLSLFAAAVVLFALLVLNPGAAQYFYPMIGLALLIGILMVLPIGGADMPVVVSLLNSYAGLAASATGFAIGNKVLIICGALDGASGLLLSMLMSKAMNRSFSQVLFGAFGKVPTLAPGALARDVEMKAISPDDAAALLAYARSVIVVPGYGLAVAQAQQTVREMAEHIERRGGEVRYAIHPVAGRMPGHMNVLLAEANIDYEKIRDMDEINGEFALADVAIVIGANDVVNPAALTDPRSPIFGMPILHVSHARKILVLKRGKGTGFAGIENELFYDEKTSVLFGDARATLTRLVAEMKDL